MKNYKRIITLLVAVLLVSGLVSCRKSDKKTVESTTSSTTLSRTASDVSDTATEAITTTAVVAATTSATSATTSTTTTQPVTEREKILRDAEFFKGKKLIAITFDDGPYTPVTTSLLERLDKFNARVTFFVLGSRLDSSESYRTTMKKAYEMGNQIASHTYSHADLTTLSDKELRKDIDKANAAIKNVIGIEPTAVRPPYGAINDKVRSEMKKNIIIWSIDPEDWKYRDSKTVCNNICKRAFDGGIVLLHDLYQTSVDGAVMAMEKLSKEGYAFVTVDELASLRGVEMDTSTKYFQFKPAEN